MLRPPGPVPEAVEAAAAAAANDNAGAAASDDERVILSRKEHARFLRQQAYRKAKEWRAKDPRHLAMKEAAKVRRRELYQQVKQKRKAADAELKSSKRTLPRAEARAEAGRALLKAVRGPR